MKLQLWPCLSHCCFLALLLLCELHSPVCVVGALDDDSYIAGYAAAVVERDFQIPGSAIRVAEGVITVSTENLATTDRQRLLNALARVPGVNRVEVHDGGAVIATASPKPEPTPVLREREHATEAERASSGPTLLPQGYLFDQLLADPRWPHFSAAYHYYISDEELASTSAVSFGETFALYRNRLPFAGLWEVGIQAGVFSLFDLDAKSKDLVNADYMGALFASYRLRDFSTFLRVFHQSSHLGDEFLLRNRVKRINLSYESVELKLSYRLFRALRLYGGGGYLFDQEPADLEPWTAQYGVEFESPWTLAGGVMTPLVAADFQTEEESNWSTNISVRAGIQFENWKLSHRRVQLLLEYFKGYSPNGQFYDRKIETIGLGAHLHF